MMDRRDAMRLAALALLLAAALSACASVGAFFGPGWFFLSLSAVLLASSGLVFAVLRKTAK